MDNFQHGASRRLAAVIFRTFGILAELVHLEGIDSAQAHPMLVDDESVSVNDPRVANQGH
jgi:hypothetical protein